jgi:hypothetical protein
MAVTVCYLLRPCVQLNINGIDSFNTVLLLGASPISSGRVVEAVTLWQAQGCGSARKSPENNANGIWDIAVLYWYIFINISWSHCLMKAFSPHFTLLTYLLTYSMEQSLSWEASCSSSSRKVTHTVWKAKFHDVIHKSPQLALTLNQITPSHNFFMVPFRSISLT